jgi:hypothetical protein
MIRKQLLSGLVGVNADDAFKSHSQADAVSMVNTTIVDLLNGEIGDIQNVLGNTNIPITLSVGAPVIIGGIYDDLNGKVYFFALDKSNNVNSAIYVYTESSGTVDNLVSNSQFSGVNALGFNNESIPAISLVNDFIVYTTGVGEVRAINITYWSANNPSSVDPSFVSLNVIAPTLQPSWSLTTAATPNLYISTKKYKFYYRFEYSDGRISPLSPGSEIKNIFELTMNSFSDIVVRMPFSQKIPAGVASVQFVAYELQSNSYIVIGKVESAASFTSHNNVTTQLSVTYDGIYTYQVLDVAETPIISFATPLNVKALEVAKNRLFFANFKDSLSNDASVSVYDTTVAVTQNLKTSNTSARCFPEGAKGGFGIRFMDKHGRTSPVYRLNSKFEIPKRHNGGAYVTAGQAAGSTAGQNPPYFYDTSNFTRFIESLTLNLSNLTPAKIPSWAASAEIMISDNTAHDDFIQFQLMTANATGGDPTTVNAKHQFGLRYAHKLDDGSFYIANSAKYIRDTYLSSTTAGLPEPQMQYYAINLRDANLIGLGWSYSEGDFVEISFLKSTTISGTITWQEIVVTGPVIAEQDNHLIIPKTGNDPIIYLGYTTDTALSNTSDVVDFGYCTIRRNPIATQTNYRETGLVFLTASVPATVTLFGDAVISKVSYIRKYNTFATLRDSLIINTQGEVARGIRTYDYFYGRQHYSSELENNILGFQKKTNLAFSGVYTEGTKNNNLNFVGLLDYESLPAELGEISTLKRASKVQEQGSVMLAIGHDNTASIYIGEAQLVGASQDADLIVNRGVLGSVNVLRGGFGTKFPSSVVERNGNVYFVDTKKAEVIRYGQNGLFEITDYKYRTVLKTICGSASPLLTITAGFDRLTDEYLLSIQDAGVNKTYNFSDEPVTTILDVNVDLSEYPGDIFSTTLTGLTQDDVIEIFLQPYGTRNYNHVKVFFDGKLVYENDARVVPYTQSMWVRFIPTSASGILLIEGLPNDPALTTDVKVTIKKYAIDYTKPHHFMPLTHRFSEHVSRWVGYSTYMPNIFLGSYTFFGAMLYKQSTATSSTFYGRSHNPAFSYYVDNVNIISVPVSHAIEGTCPSKHRLASEVHATTLVAADYTQAEQMFRASFLRDKISGSQLSGKRLRGSKLLSLFRMPSTFAIRRIFTEVKDSTGH